MKTEKQTILAKVKELSRKEWEIEKTYKRMLKDAGLLYIKEKESYILTDEELEDEGGFLPVTMWIGDEKYDVNIVSIEFDKDGNIKEIIGIDDDGDTHAGEFNDILAGLSLSDLIDVILNYCN